jgi:N-succinyldiaminopimelate aminotransferase
LNLPSTYYDSLQDMYTNKCRLLTVALDRAGFTYAMPQGTYFMLADFSNVFSGTQLEFTQYMIREIGVACIPPASFYSAEHASIGQNYIRFTFCKSDDMLLQAQERMAKLRPLHAV